ncbi:MAG: peptidylprolyl isomerase [Rickettsiales bacterium]
MRQFVAPLALALLISVATPALADDYVLMKVNSQDITSSEAQQQLEGLFPAGQAPTFDSLKPDLRDKLLRGIMAEKVLYGEAVKSGIDKSDAVAKQLEDIKKKLIVRALLDQKAGGTISEADLKNEYDKMLDGIKDEREVRARHILLPTEQEAKDAKKQLDSGKSFEEVAKQSSKDPGSAKQGGDLGYFTKDKMVKEFADAAFAMKKGEVSGPVKSAFGWHIIKVEDSRKVQAPTFNEVKETLKAKLQEKKLNDYVEGLVKSADVKLYDAKGKELPFTKIPAPDKADKAK